MSEPGKRDMPETSTEVWTLSEQVDGRLRPVSYELLAWGKHIAGKLPEAPLCSVVLGSKVARSDIQELILRGADKVYLAEAPALEHFLVEPHAAVLERMLRDRRPNIMIAGATSVGRTLMPYLAVRLTTGLTADCTGLDIDRETGNLIQTRPAIGGNVLATIITARHRPQMATVRPHSMKPPVRAAGRHGEVIEIEPPEELLASRVERLGFRALERDEGNIADAEKVVSGGRGLKRADNFVLV
ncbi:MAG: electron transfer flavoprotein subunit alpha/FixB family protein, partial [Candidatus Brocadiae bacterium]|nr:electron transfer flavoprotein subunit alpha/FixB family protein [Candidatus Brocadiia bacterium]